MTITTIDVSISSVDLRQLRSQPKLLIPAPGPGSYIKMLSWEIHFVAGVTPYIVGDVPSFIYEGSDITKEFLSPATDIFAQIVDAVAYGNATTLRAGIAQYSLPRTKVENKAVMLADDVDWPTGDGTAMVKLAYEIVIF